MKKFKVTSYHKSNALMPTNGGTLFITENEYIIKYLFITVARYKIKNTTVSGTTTSIEIETEFPVYITCGDKTLEITFTGGTVADAIKQAGFSIDEHDFETKLNHAKKFLKDGDKVKVSIRFRGREIAHAALGAKNLERFRDALSEYGTADKAPKLEGRSMHILIAPGAKKD